MNRKQLEIWEKQKRRECESELERLREDFASRGLAMSGMRNKAEVDLKVRYESEIEIAKLGVEDLSNGHEATKGTERVGDLPDEELLAIIRRAENTNVPGSLYQKANTEWQIRHQQKILAASGQNRSGVFFEVVGDMTNHGVIQTDSNATVDIAVAGNYSSNSKTKIIQGVAKNSKKEWYEKPLGIVSLAVTAGLIIAAAVFYMHWN
jgi:hypothetical protein